MRYSQLRHTLTEASIGPGAGMEQELQTIIMTMSAHGYNDIPTASFIEEVKQQFGIDVDLRTVIDMLNSFPAVKSADAQKIEVYDAKTKLNLPQKRIQKRKLLKWRQRVVVVTAGLIRKFIKAP